MGLIRMVGEHHEILYARFYTAEESLSPSISGRRAQLVIRMGRVLKIAQKTWTNSVDPKAIAHLLQTRALGPISEQKEYKRVPHI